MNIRFSGISGTVLLLLCLTFIASSMIWREVHADSRLKVIKFGKLVTGTGTVIKNARVVIEDDKIVSVSQGDSEIPTGAQVIDLSKFTGIPGLIDVHTHMTYYWDGKPGSDPWRQGGQRMPAVTVFLAQENARKTLETGVTTVRDLGSSEYMDIAMRDLINRGAMPGPRMFVSGYGLHSVPRAAPEGTAPSRGRAHGAAEVAIAVKQQVDAGADVIKVYGSTGSGQDVTGRETFTFEEMKAAVDAAHQYGKRIAIHSYGPDGARDAVRAGADSLEHATDLDDNTIQELAHSKTFYVPTIDHNRYYVDYHQQFNYSAEAVANLNDYIKRNLETARKAFKAGARFAMGSDAVFNMFGQNTREVGWLVKAGMTPEQALAAATINGAALLGMEKSLGAIAPGYYADIVAVEGDPFSDVDVVINHVKWVMKGGSVVVDRSK
jgi:imidazolonepropionase-like amidohydrolase